MQMTDHTLDHTLKILTGAKANLLPWKQMA